MDRISKRNEGESIYVATSLSGLINFSFFAAEKVIIIIESIALFTVFDMTFSVLQFIGVLPQQQIKTELKKKILKYF